jgi:phage terminase large subunit-like protein
MNSGPTGSLRNFGGALVEHTIRTADPNIAYREVIASRGKIAAWHAACGCGG